MRPLLCTLLVTCGQEMEALSSMDPANNEQDSIGNRSSSSTILPYHANAYHGEEWQRSRLSMKASKRITNVTKKQICMSYISATLASFVMLPN